MKSIDDVTVPSGYRWEPVIRWGDPILPGAPEFRADRQTPRSQAGQFGYNCDYLDIIVDGHNDQRALLVANHEYTNENIMFPPGTPAETVVRTAWAAHGLSVVELRRTGVGRAVGVPAQRPPQPPDHPRHRRSTWTARPPAARCCKTARRPDRAQDPRHDEQLLRRHHPVGHRAVGRGELQPVLLRHRHQPRGPALRPVAARTPAAGATSTRAGTPRTEDYKNEPNRFGWVIEVDPEDPDATPVKHTAMGRFKHEGANVIVAADRSRGRLHGRRRALRLRLQVRLEGPVRRAARAARRARTTSGCSPRVTCTSPASPATGSRTASATAPASGSR